MPPLQTVHKELDVLPALDVVPPGQLAQTVALEVSDELAPIREYLPAGHVTFPEQAADVNAGALPNVPEGQSRHSDPVKAADS